MKSRIKMEFDFDLNEPYIEVTEIYSDDLRDRMFRRFRQMFGYESNKCSIEFDEHPSSDGITTAIYKIRPIKQLDINIESFGSHETPFNNLSKVKAFWEDPDNKE